MDVGSVKQSSSATLHRLPAAAQERPAVAESAGGPAGRSVQESQPVAKLEAEASRVQMEDALSTIQQFAQSVRRNLEFQLDESSGRVVVKVTDGESGDVVRQIPSEDALRLAESLDEVRSLLFKAEA